MPPLTLQLSLSLLSRVSMRASRVLLVVLSAAVPLLPALAQNQRLRVSVSHSGSDVVGQQLAYAVREAVRASQAFRLVPSEEAEYQIRLLTQDPDRSDTAAGGQRTIVAITYVMVNTASYRKEEPATWYPLLLNTSIARAGGQRIDDVARSAVATLDNALEEHRKLSRNR